MSFRRRSYPEVLGNLLAAATGGVSAEAHPFPPPGSAGTPFAHPLERPPVATVDAVWGVRDGAPHRFRDGKDYRLQPDAQTLLWVEGGELPDAGTLVEVTYTPAAALPVVTDVFTGSVVRTLLETVSLELARVYASLEGVYRSGFLDTAEGAALDNVVALLGIERVAGGRPAGVAEFTRAPGAPGAVTVLAGTRVATADASVEYETLETVTLAPGQRTIRVGVRDLEENGPVEAGALTVLPIPVSGIAGVTNPAPTAIASQSETDAELRARARNFLHGSERATLRSLELAVTRQGEGLRADVVDAEDDPTLAPGIVRVTPHVEVLTPELEQRLRTAIRDARPAGVRVLLEGVRAPARVDLSLRLETVPGVPEAELRGIQRSVREEVEGYFARLQVRENGSIGQITGRILSIAGVKDVRVVSATVRDGEETIDVLDREAGTLELAGFPTVLGDLQVVDPAIATQLTAVVLFTAPPVPDAAAIRAALNLALAHLNAANETEIPADATDEARAAEAAKREVSWPKLLFAIPLGDRPAGALSAWDAEVAAGSEPEVDAGAFRVEFALAFPGGTARILAGSSDVYHPAPLERLALAEVVVEEEGGDGA